jgi:hypothetical protein
MSQNAEFDIRNLEQPIAFVHIPKTAGTAFTRYLISNMPSRECVSPAFIKSYEAIEWENPRLKLFWGHFPFRDVRKLLLHAHFVTFLRDPIARSISLYRSWSNPKNLPPGDPWRAAMTPEELSDIEFVQQASLDEFVLCDRPRLLAGLQDAQTSMLSITGDNKSPLFLRSAKETLEEGMSFFGIVERFSESIALFRSVFTNTSDYEVSTVAENRSEIIPGLLSLRARERLEELNANDLKLYDFALGLFRRRVASLGL